MMKAFSFLTILESLSKKLSILRTKMHSDDLRVDYESITSQLRVSRPFLRTSFALSRRASHFAAILTILFTVGVGSVSAQGVSVYDRFGYGRNATGGGSATPILVDTESELRAALRENSVVIITEDITVTSQIKITDDDFGNVTLMALPGKKLISNVKQQENSGILYLKGSNIIIRNVTFVGPGAMDCDGEDLLGFDGVTNAWVDHCDFQDGLDGNFDIKGKSDNITISWCRFRYLKAPTPVNQADKSDDHRYTNLLGSSSTDKPSDNTYNITYAYNWWDEGCVERMVRCRNASLHFLNCYWNTNGTASYYIGPENVDCYIEGCYFTAIDDDNVFYQNYSKGTAKNGVTYKDSYYGNGTNDRTTDVLKNVSDRTVTSPSYSYPTAKTYTAAKTEITSSCGAGATLLVTENGDVQQCYSNVQQFTVTFDLNGKGEDIIQTVYDGLTIPTPTTPTAIGYTFEGWYTDPECTNAYDFSTEVTSDITLYAKWTENNYCYEFTPATTGETLGVGSTIGGEGFGGTMKVASMKEAGKSISYDANGLKFSGGSNDQVLVELEHKMQVGTIITLTLVSGGSGARGLNLLTETGTKKSELTWAAASGEQKEFSYTVDDSDGLEETNSFKLQRNNSIYLKHIAIENCAGSETPDPEPDQPVTGVSLNKTTTTLEIGETETLTATIEPDNATNKNVTWSSSNESVATVQNGVVTAVAAGTATITVTTADGNKTATCAVTVNAASGGGSGDDSYMYFVAEADATANGVKNSQKFTGVPTGGSSAEGSFSFNGKECTVKKRTGNAKYTITFEMPDGWTNATLVLVHNQSSRNFTLKHPDESTETGENKANGNFNENTFTITQSGTYTISNSDNIGLIFIGLINNSSASTTTYTLTNAVNTDGYGTVSPASVSGIPSGTATSSNSNTYTVNGTTVTATPTANTAQYTYAFDSWSGLPATVTSDATVTANFTRTPKNYTLTWNLDGGSITTVGTATGQVAYGTAITAPTVTKTGYTFNGWNQSVASTMPANDVTYTAQWTANQYDITYKDQGNADFSGTHGANYPTEHTYGTATTLVEPEKANYEFGGWYTNSGCTGSAVTSLGATAYTANITLYAKWNCIAPTSVTISGAWDKFGGETISLTATATGGSGNYTYQWKHNGENIEGATEATYTKDNCTLEDGGNYSCVVSTGETCSKESSQFGLKVYTLECYTDGVARYNFVREGTAMKGSVQVPLANNKQYEFKINAGGGAEFFFGNNGTINADISNWTFEKDNNNVKLNSGLGGTFVFTIDYTDNGNVPKISVTYPRKTIYMKCGSSWCDASPTFFVHTWGNGDYDVKLIPHSCANDVYVAENVPAYNSHLVFTRQKPGSTEIAFNGDNFWNQSVDITIGTNDLFTCTGWSDNKRTFSSGTYTPATYSITFNGNGNTGGSMTNVTGITCGEDRTLAENGFARTGYTFAGWKANVNVTIGGSTVTAGTVIANSATIQNISQNITLTAQWSPIKVSSITVAPSSKTLEVGGTQQLTATVNPDNALDKTVTWSTSNGSVATVSSTGLVTAVAEGTATITATANDGSGKTGTCSITVNKITPATYTFSADNTSICSGSDVTFTLAGSQEGATYYVTKSSGGGSAIGDSKAGTGSSLSFTVPSATAGDYYCYTSETTNYKAGKVSKSKVTITHNTATSITTQPTNQEVTVGEEATLSVVAAGTSLSYQWKESATEDGEYSNVSTGSGETSASYSVTPAAAGTKWYKCVVTGTCGEVTTEARKIVANAAVTYTVTYDAQGGTCKASDTGSSITLPTPTKDDYTFQGWYTSGGELVSSPYSPTADITLHALWRSDECAGGGGGSTTLFNVDFTDETTEQIKASTSGASWVAKTYDSYSMSFGSKNDNSGIIDVINNTGLRFTGNNMNNYNCLAIPLSLTKDKEVTAVITLGDATQIKYNWVSGALPASPNNGSSGSNYGTNNEINTLTYTPTSTGNYVLYLGRSGSSSGKVVKSIVITQAGGGSGTCYYVTYNGNGADGGYVNDANAYAANEEVTTLANSFTHAGYTFTGWNTKADGTGTSYAAGGTFTITENTELFAQWTENAVTPDPGTQYTVTFDANGHGTAPAAQTVAGGGTITEPTNLTAQDYVFLGWYTDQACTTAFNFSTAINSDITLYAKWNEMDILMEDRCWNISEFETCTITAPQTINQLHIVATPNEEIIIDKGSKTIDDISFTNRLKYGGKGSLTTRNLWFSVKGDCAITIYMITANNNETRHLALAKGSFDDKDKVTFEAVGKGDNTEGQKVTYNYTGDATPIFLYPTDNGVNIYQICVKYPSTPTPDPEPGSYTLTYNENKPSVVWVENKFAFKNIPAEQTLTNGTGNVYNGNTPVITEEEGSNYAIYTFAGWNTAEDGTGKSYAAGAAITITENTTLYAQWTPQTFDVKYFDDDKATPLEGMVNTTYTFGVGIPTLPTPTKPGHTFIKWIAFWDGGEREVTQIEQTDWGDAQLAALWEVNCTMPTTTFANTRYTIGGALDLSTLISDNNSGGAITYAVTGGVAATIDESSFTCDRIGVVTVTATQAANGDNCEKIMTATINVAMPVQGGCAQMFTFDANNNISNPDGQKGSSYLDLSSYATINGLSTTGKVGIKDMTTNTSTNTTLIKNSEIYFPNTNTYLKVENLSTPLAAGDKISIGTGQSATTEYIITISGTQCKSNCITTAGQQFIIPEESSLIGVTTFYIWSANAERYLKTIDICRPAYEITYKANNGTQEADVVLNDAVLVAGCPNTFTVPAGKQFAGWNTDEEGKGTSYSVGTIIPVNNLILYAQWKCIEPVFTVSCDKTAYAKDEEDVSPITVSVTAGNSGGVTYQWFASDKNDRITGTAITGETADSYTPSTTTAGTTYYWCEISNSCTTVKTPTIAITVTVTKNNPAVTWTNPTGVNYGGGGYEISATVNNEWNGTLLPSMLTAPTGVIIKGVTITGKTITATFDVTTTFDRTADKIPFVLTLPETTTYNPKVSENKVSYDACDNGGGTKHRIPVKEKSDQQDINPYNRWDTENIGWITWDQGGGTISSESATYNNFSYRTKSGKQVILIYSKIQEVKTIRIYGYGSNATECTAVSVGKEYNKYTKLSASEYAFNGNTINNRENGVIEISFTTPLKEGTYVQFNFSKNALFYGVELETEGGEEIVTTLSFATTGTIEKQQNDANFTNKATPSNNTLGTITYSSSNTDVATVNSTTGEVSIIAAGTTTITATLAPSGCYQGATATYALTVTEQICAIAAGTLSASKTDKYNCEEVILTLSNYEQGATIQWWHNGEAIDSKPGITINGNTLKTTLEGTYSAFVTKDCSVRSNSITITNIASASATPLVNEWYIKSGRLTPPIALWKLEGGARIAGVGWMRGEEVSTAPYDNSATAIYEENGIVYLTGTPPQANETGEDIRYTIQLSIYNSCDDSPMVVPSTITIVHQKNTDKHVLAFVVTGTQNGGFTEGITTAQTTNVALYNEISQEFDVLATNIYATDNEQLLKEYYSRFDIICITDYPNTKETGVNGKSYTNAMGALIDIRPILSMEAWVSKYSNWNDKGVTGDPKSPTTRQYSMLLQCKDHEIFAGTNLIQVGSGDELMYRVTMVDKNQEQYKTLDDTYGATTPHAEKATTKIDGEETITGYGYGSNPALQGFTYTSAMSSMLPIGTIDDGDGNNLQVGLERQYEIEARMIVLGVNSYAMERLTDDGERVIINTLKYLMKKQSSEIADCSIYFDNNNGKGDNQWNNPANWAPSRNSLPQASQEARILAPCVVSGIVAKVASIKIVPDGKYAPAYNGGIDAKGSLTIAPDGALVVGGHIQAATAPNYYEARPTTPENLIVQADATGSGALIHGEENGELGATVELVSKAYSVKELNEQTGKYKKKKYWQYVALPVREALAEDAFWGAYTYQYDETKGWIKKGTGERIEEFWGVGLSIDNEVYSGANNEQALTKFTIKGNLALAIDRDIDLTKTPDAGEGQNMIGNSWTAPIHLTSMTEDDFENATATVYIYNTGRDEQASGSIGTASSADGSTQAGQWISIPIAASALDPWQGPKVIPAMQAFEVDLAEGKTSGILHLNYDKHVRTIATPEEENLPLRAPKYPSDRPSMIRLRVADSTTYTDLYLIEGDQFTDEFDNAWDGKYQPCDGRSATLYAMSPIGDMAVLAQPSVNNTSVVFEPGKKTEYVFTFGYNGEVTYYLNDMQLKTSTEIKEGNEYRFTYNKGDMKNRFLVTRESFDSPNISTGLANIVTDGNGLQVTNPNQENLQVILIDAAGRLCSIYNTAEPMFNIELPATQGVYMINVRGETTNIVRKVVK